MSKRALVVQGGGFRTAFSAGVLDAFLVGGLPQFDSYLAVSGGTIALSYYLSGQYSYCLEAMLLLAKDPHFVKFSRAMSDAGYMDIDYMERIALEIMPFDLSRALKAVEEKDIQFVATARDSALPSYLRPNTPNWIDLIIASCTLPFVTKGRHRIGDKDYFDGGWSDPIPVRKAAELGANDILVIRTAPAQARIKQSWPDYFGSFYFRSNPALKSCFDASHKVYNETIDYMENPPEGITIRQIAPDQSLLCGTYSYSVESLKADYRYGLDLGLQFIQRSRAQVSNK